MSATAAWLPLESNPDVMNKYLQKLGVPATWNMVDVMGLDPEVLAWVPRPVVAVLLLFPCSDTYESHKMNEEAQIAAKGQYVPDDLFYLKQLVSNACGTVALVHSVANNVDRIQLSEGWMKKYIEETKGLDPAGRGDYLVKSDELAAAHLELAREGQTNTPGADDPINHHFIALVHKDGGLYELDGRKAFPVHHGSTSPDTLLEDAAVVCREFMARDPNEVRFTVVALTAAE